MNAFAWLAPLVLALPAWLPAQTTTAASVPPAGDNAALTSLFTVDQSAREGNHIDWGKLIQEDEQRRQQVHHMLDTGEVRTGNDFFHAAMIFQHGQNPDEYLLAHILAMDAVAQGSKEARWLAAATLDRYLLSSGNHRSSAPSSTAFQTPPPP